MPSRTPRSATPSRPTGHSLQAAAEVEAVEGKGADGVSAWRGRWAGDSGPKGGLGRAAVDVEDHGVGQGRVAQRRAALDGQTRLPQGGDRLGRYAGRPAHAIE